MKASEIMLDESLPHGTPDGWAAGCRGSHCPGKERLGMSCSQAYVRYASDYSYRRRLDRGLSPEAIAAEDALDGVQPAALVDSDTRHTPVHPAPTVTVEHSHEPLPAEHPAATSRPPKWAVRRLWVAVSPAGVMYGPFDGQPAGTKFVTEQLSHDLTSGEIAPEGPAAAPARRTYRRFTTEDEVTLRALHAEGNTDGQIARSMDRGKSMIAIHRERLGLAANRAGARS